VTVAHVALDLGQTGCRVRRLDLAGAAWPGGDLQVPGHGAGGSVDATLRRALQSAADAWGSDLEIPCLAIGLTGLHGRIPEAPRLRGSLPPGWRVAELRAMDDSIGAYLCGLETRTGVVVVVGTGVAATAWDGADRWAHGDGRGPLLGDWGGGFWVGSRALRHVGRMLDGVGPATTLLDRAEQRFGSRSEFSWTLAWDASVVARIAAFCVDVVAAADEGDVVAMRIVADAAQELRRTTVATARRAGLGGGQGAFAMVGEVARAGDVLMGPWSAGVIADEPGLRWVDTAGRTPLDALSALTMGAIPLGFETVVARA